MQRIPIRIMSTGQVNPPCFCFLVEENGSYKLENKSGKRTVTIPLPEFQYQINNGVKLLKQNNK